MEIKERDDHAPFTLLGNEIAELRETFGDRLDSMALTLKQAEDVKESLTGKIHELEERIKERERLIGVRATEVRELRTKLDILTTEMTQKEARLKEAEAVAAREVRQSKELKESLTAKLNDLETRSREKDKMLEVRGTEVRELRSKLDHVTNEMAQTESTLKEAAALATREAQEAKSAKESLMSRMDQLERQAKAKEELLEKREVELKDLRTRTQTLMNRITRMESLFKAAEALVASEGTEGGEVSARSAGPEPKGDGGQSPISNTQRAEPVSEQPSPAKVAPETVSPLFFDRMVRVLTEAMGPMASLVVRDQIAALDESSEAFPKERLRELVDAVSKEVSDESLRLRFRQQMAEEIKGGVGAKGAAVEPQFKPKEAGAPKVESVTKDAHEGLSSRIQSLEGQLRDREGLLKIREAELQNLKSKMASKADGGGAVHVEKVERSQAEVNSLIQAKEEEIRKLREQMSAEMERLKSELKQKKVLLAEMERNEWRAKGLKGIWRRGFGS